MIRAWIGVYLQKVDDGRIDPTQIDHLLCHYSAQSLREEIVGLLETTDAMIPQERWFTTLARERQRRLGLDLDHARRADALRRLRAGEKILCIVPESGRAHGRLHDARSRGGCVMAAVPASSIRRRSRSPRAAQARHRLGRASKARLEATPLIRKLTRGRFELADYHAFLIQLRQQVKDGALWMSRAASNIDEAHLELRSLLMRHAVTEHRDFRLLDADFVASGGAAAEIQTRGEERRLGGAVGLDVPRGVARPTRSACWARCSSSRAWVRSRRRNGADASRRRLDAADEAVRFLLYHGENDAGHMRGVR